MAVDTIPEVTDVRVLGHWRLRLTFDDGLQGDVDLSNLADAGPMYEPLRDKDFFGSAYIGELTGTVTWPGEIDLDPEGLYAIAREHPVHGPGRPAGTWHQERMLFEAKDLRHLPAGGRGGWTQALKHLLRGHGAGSRR
jgi:hypothetical protein